MRKVHMINLLLAKAKSERSKIVSINRQDARTRAMELCHDLTSCDPQMAHAAQRYSGEIEHADFNAVMVSEEDSELQPSHTLPQQQEKVQVVEEVEEDEEEEEDNEEDGERLPFCDAAFSTATLNEPEHMHVEHSNQFNINDVNDDYDDFNEHDELRRLFGREAFDELMIQIENVLMAEDEDLESSFDADHLLGESLDDLYWDDDRFIMCPLCKRLPMEIREVECTATCACCSIPISLLRRPGSASGVFGGQGLTKTEFENLLGDEYDRCARHKQKDVYYMSTYRQMDRPTKTRKKYIQ